MYIDEMIQKAGVISRELCRVKRAERALNELRRLQDGKSKQFEDMLDLSESQIEKAIDRGHEELNLAMNELREVMI